MVNYNDPVVVLLDSWALVKLCHAVDSLYLWEFFTSLEYEWSVIRGHRTYRWSIWIYSLTRLSALASVILNFIGIDVTTPFNCQVWISFEVTFGSIAIIAASLLMLLRVIAIWNKDRVVVAIATGVWVTNIAFLIQGTTRLHAKWLPQEDHCMVPNSESGKLNIIVTLVTDAILLLLMLVGLLRIRRYGGSTSCLAHFMWKQGVVWFFLATIAEVPPTVLISLNLNGPLNQMLQVPAVTILVIAATRMYRSLVDFASETTDIIQDLPQASNHMFSRTKGTPRACTPVAQMDINMHAVYKQYPASQMGSSSVIDGQLQHSSLAASDGDVLVLEDEMVDRPPW